mgnify:CR=1 FL=1
MLKHLKLIGLGVLLTACGAGGADEPSLAEAYGRQVPVDAQHVTEIWIDLPTSVFIKVVAMNDVTVGSFQSGMEYWYASATSLGEEDELDFGSQSGSYTSTQINQFIGELDPVFEWTQEIGTQGWTQGTYSPVADQARLYRAADPDDSQKLIGLLIEQDSSDNLRGITWYKQDNTGKIFDTTPGELTFTVVTNQQDEPSTDPADIDAGTWYYAYSGD